MILEEQEYGYLVTQKDWRREAYAPKTLASDFEEAKAYLRTLANFGGTIQQAKELAQKCLDKLEN